MQLSQGLRVKFRMSNKRIRNSEHELNKRLAFDAALAIGILGFTLSLWKIPGFTQFLIALSIGVVAGLLSFVIIYFAGKYLTSYFGSDLNDDSDTQTEASSEVDREVKLAKDITLSIHSPSNYDENPDKRDKRPNLETILPRQWSSYLVDTIEWRVFDRLCIAFWRLKGNKISGIAERTHDGVDFFISAPTNKQYRVAVIQTRSSQAASPTVEDMKNLLRLRDRNNLSVAMLMFAGKLSKVVHSFCVSNDIRLLGSDNITKGLRALSDKDQKQLLKALIKPDYAIPSCPSCLIKLTRRQSIKSGRIFWGCVSYPKCNFTINSK